MLRNRPNEEALRFVRQLIQTRSPFLAVKFLWRQIGWFTALYATVVGAPSVLSVVQSILKAWRLTPALQWVIDGYHQLTDVIGLTIEPFVMPVIKGIADKFSISVELDPLWRPLFLLLLIPLVAQIRGFLFGEQNAAKFWEHRDANKPPLTKSDRWVRMASVVIVPSFCSIPLLLMALLANITWGSPNPLLTALTTFVVALLWQVSAWLFMKIDWGDAAVACAAAVFAAGLFYIPSVGRHAEIVAIAAVILGRAMEHVYYGIEAATQAHSRLQNRRMYIHDATGFVQGLGTLGGFATALLIVAADQMVKLLSN